VTKRLFETTQVYTITDDDGVQYSVIVTHHLPNDSYAYEINSLEDMIVTGCKHNEILSYVLGNIDK